jgi:hypothetical protein
LKMPVDPNQTNRRGENDITRRGENAQPYENGNPSWQSNSKVGSRFRVEENKASYTWKNKKQSGLSSREIEKLPIFGSRGDFNNQPIAKIVNQVEGPPDIYLLNRTHKKTRYKSIKASEGALKRNNWVIYVQLALQAANSLPIMAARKVKYPEAISDIVLQAMFHAKDANVASPINPLMYQLFNPWTYSRYATGTHIVNLVQQELNQNRNYFEMIRNDIARIWNNFCITIGLNPNPGLQIWERYGDHSTELNGFIQQRQNLIDSNIFNPSHRQIDRLDVELNRFPGAEPLRIMDLQPPPEVPRPSPAPLPPPEVPRPLTAPLPPPEVPRPRRRTIIEGSPEDRYELEPVEDTVDTGGFDLPMFDSEDFILPTTMTILPSTITKEKNIEFKSDLQGANNKFRTLINMIPEETTLYFILDNNYLRGMQHIYYINSRTNGILFAPPIDRYFKEFLQNYYNDESSINDLYIQSMGAALFMFYYFSELYNPQVKDVSYIVANAFNDARNKELLNMLLQKSNIFSIKKIDDNQIVIYHYGNNAHKIIAITTEGVEINVNVIKSTFFMNRNVNYDIVQLIALKNNLVTIALFRLFYEFQNKIISAKIPTSTVRMNIAFILNSFGGQRVPLFPVQQQFYNTKDTANLTDVNLFSLSSSWGSVRGSSFRSTSQPKDELITSSPSQTIVRRPTTSTSSQPTTSTSSQPVRKQRKPSSRPFAREPTVSTTRPARTRKEPTLYPGMISSNKKRKRNN